MQCQVCRKNEATIHLTEISEGARSEMHLCEYCAQAKDIAVESHVPVNELLSSLLEAQPSDEEDASFAGQGVACPNCGFTLKQFQKESVLGCPYDYEVLEDSLLPLIGKAHDGKTTHCGKVPSKVPDQQKKQIELAALRQQLQSAVQNEDYELAAKLRDRINQLG